MSDIFSRFAQQGSFGRVAGDIFANRKKGDEKELLKFLALETIIQGVQGYNTAQTQARDDAIADLSVASKPLISGLTSEYTQNNAKREKLRQYNDPTTRDSFLYKEAIGDLDTFANEVSQGKVFTVKELERYPQYRTALNNRLQSKRKELENYYELLNQDALYSSQTLEDYIKPYLSNITAKKKLIEDDPTKQGAFRSFINMTFGNGADDLVELHKAVKDTTTKIEEREAKQAFVKRLLQGDLARLEGMDTEQEFLATSRFGKIVVDNKEYNTLANGISATAMDDGYKNYDFLKYSKLKKMKVISPDGKESNMSPFAALGNSTAKIALFLKNLDTQSQGLGEDVELKSDQEYVNDALEFLLNNKAITEDSIKLYDSSGFRQIKDAFKRGRDFPGMDAAAMSAYMDSAQINNALDIDVYLRDEVAQDFNMLRSQLIKTTDADKQQEIIGQMGDLSKLYFGLGDLSEGLPIEDRELLQKMDKARLIEILNLEENDNSYIKIGNLRKRGYEFDYDIKKKFYLNYIGEYGADADLKNLLNKSKPEQPSSMVELGASIFPEPREDVEEQVKALMPEEEKVSVEDSENISKSISEQLAEGRDIGAVTSSLQQEEFKQLGSDIYNLFENQQMKSDKKRLQQLVDGEIFGMQEDRIRRNLLPKYNLAKDASNDDILKIIEEL
jgi:hypothetical protein